MNNGLLIMILVGSLIGIGLLGLTVIGDNNMMGDWGWNTDHHEMMHGNHHHEDYEHHEECEEDMDEECGYEDYEKCKVYSEECEEHEEEYWEHHAEDNENTRIRFKSLLDSDKININI